MEDETTATSLAPVTKLFGMGAEMFGQIEHMVGNNKVTGLRVKLGNRVVKQFPITSAATAVTIALALLAVIVNALSIEVEHEPAASPA